MTEKRHRSWMAFGVCVALLGFATMKQLRHGSENDAASKRAKASTITTLKEQFQQVSDHVQHVIDTGKQEGTVFVELAKQDVAQYQEDIQPSIERIQESLNELSQLGPPGQSEQGVTPPASN